MRINDCIKLAPDGNLLSHTFENSKFNLTGRNVVLAIFVLHQA